MKTKRREALRLLLRSSKRGMQQGTGSEQEQPVPGWCKSLLVWSGSENGFSRAARNEETRGFVRAPPTGRASSEGFGGFRRIAPIGEAILHLGCSPAEFGWLVMWLG